ncbi:hypothetical protein [Candidatus Chloroploca sp. Khr17]|uniref:hypothetical protein n=1 Tax=Candidatus Chloroploca sp. Khr17 TaxID=2496869 RepID=UPI00101BDACD|nr:hypothetical protein [Candidatus Chloroploca sp. Khr17]
MLMKVHYQVLRISTWRNVFILLAIFIGMNLFLMYSAFSPMMILQGYSGGAGILDIDWLYTADHAYAVLTAYGQAGRSYYLSVFSVVDLFTPILMNLFLAMSISMVFGRAFPADHPLLKLNLLPFVAMAGDYLENILIVVLILAYPARLDGLATAASLFTAIKFVFTIISVLCIVAGLTIWRWPREASI